MSISAYLPKHHDVGKLEQTEFLQDLCLQYQETLVYAHLTQLKESSSPELIATVDRLKDELANRRQFHYYLRVIIVFQGLEVAIS